MKGINRIKRRIRAGREREREKDDGGAELQRAN